MDPSNSAFLKLIRSGLLGLPCEVPADADWAKIFEISENQVLHSIVFRAVTMSKAKIPQEYMTKLRMGLTADIRLHRAQQEELDAIFASFDAEGIEYLPLKGTETKAFYPRPEYRTMSDADIVIPMDRYERIAQIVSARGFTFEKQSDHELTWRKQKVCIEFHKHVLDPNYGSQKDASLELFAGSERVEGSCRRRLGGAEELAYSVAHFAKHFCVGGSRIHSMTDIYYIMKNRSIDRERFAALLGEMKLTEFFEILKSAIDSWMAGEELDEKGSLLMDNVLSESYEFNAARFYTMREARERSGGNKNSSAGMLAHFFPDLKTMRGLYPPVDKCPALLPVFWAVRGFSAVFVPKKRQRLNQFLKLQREDADERLDAYMGQLKALGLEDMSVPEDL